MYKDIDFVYEAIRILEVETGYNIKIDTHEDQYDIILHINQIKFHGVTQKNAKNYTFGILMSKVKELNKDEKTILLADYLPAKTAMQLKENNINYLDASGNAFINTKGVFIYIKGKKQKNKTSSNETRAFQETGLKLILILLSEPDALQLSFRKLAEYAEISLGSVSNIFNELEANNFLLRTVDKRILKNKEALLEQWVINYANILKPKNYKRRFRGTLSKTDLLQNVKDNSGVIDIGGEYAAELITNKFVAKNITLYSNEETAKIVRHFHLIPDDKGEIELYNKFWSKQLKSKHKQLAPTLVIYAELINTGIERNIEIAKYILENEL